MTTKRRTGGLTSKTRAALLEAAVTLIAEEGVFALTAGRLGDRVGVKRQTVHYYFRTIDDLLVAVLRHGFERTLVEVRAFLPGKDPLDAIWCLFGTSNPVTSEFMALALRNEAIGAAWSACLLSLQSVLSEAFAARGDEQTDRTRLDAAALVVQITAQNLSFEAALGITRQHDAVRSLVDTVARQLLDKNIED